VINVFEGAWVANGPFRSLANGAALAIETANTDLTSNNLDTVRLAISGSSNVVRSGCKGFDTITSHEAMKWRKNVVIFR